MLTLRAFMSLWNSFSQYLGSAVNIALSVTVAPSLLSSHSDIGPFADCNRSFFAFSIFSASSNSTANFVVLTAAAILKIIQLRPVNY